MSKWAETHLPCEDCGSSDGYSVDLEGNGYCFVCQEFTSADGSSNTAVEKIITSEQSDLILGGEHLEIPARKISKTTCEFFDVKISNDNIVFPYYDSDRSLVSQKCRPLKEKTFFWKGSPNKGTLFGQNKFSSGQYLTIVEGEFDALAFRDLLGDYPVVSIPNGAQTAAKDIRKHLEYFENFQKVYICFDNDEHGRAASLKVAELFPIGKAKIVHLTHHKDACDYLVNGDREKFKKCWWNAEDYTPAGIEAANEGGFESLFEDIDNLDMLPYPYDKLNEFTFGKRKGEMVTIVAGSGVGKSAFVREVSYLDLMETKEKVGMLMLEEATRKTKLGFMSIFLSKPLHLTLLARLAKKFKFIEKVLDNLFKTNPDCVKFDENTKKELKHAWMKVIEKKAEDGSLKLWLFNHFGSNNIDKIVATIDAMVTGLGCGVVYLDHISIVVSEQQNADERKALDELATKLRTLVERRNFSLVIVSHLRRPGGKPHEEGGETSLADIRGTAGIGQLSDIVIGLERNGQHTDEFLRNVTKVRVLKNRFAGFTGLTSYVHYDIETGRLTEIDPKVVEDLENPEKHDTEFIPHDDDKPVFDETPSGERVNEERKDKVA